MYADDIKMNIFRRPESSSDGEPLSEDLCHMESQSIIRGQNIPNLEKCKKKNHKVKNVFSARYRKSVTYKSDLKKIEHTIAFNT